MNPIQIESPFFQRTGQSDLSKIESEDSIGQGIRENEDEIIEKRSVQDYRYLPQNDTRSNSQNIKIRNI